MINYPKLGEALTPEQENLLSIFAKSCRKSILEMVTNAQSGHPGGSLSCIDYLATIYAFIIGQTGEKIVVSNGHISPGVYSTLAEMGYIQKEEVIKTFRQAGSIFEGHITRHVDGIWYGTGPLGVGVSVASAFAKGEKMKGTNAKVFALVGDGECQEGQVHEMIHFSKQHKLDNYILFVDFNKVQLTASLKEVQDIDIRKMFEAGDWEVLEVDGHNYQEMWTTLAKAYAVTGKPVVILGHTIMGKGVDFMETTGQNNQADWHGKAPKPEQIVTELARLTPTPEEEALLNNFRETVKWHPTHAKYPEKLSKLNINTGTPRLYDAETITDCRTAYGQALLDLAKLNPQVIALTADLKGSVMTKFVADELPAQYIECGIAEQHMVSATGALSLDGYIPFCSTFGAFMSSRAKDQARVNDINYTNVKMVATHCGLSVGEDGPTHQAIDDMGSFLGMFNTMVIEPADPNQTDHIIRYISAHFGNFYVRMGRHKFPNITKEDGTIFYDASYTYEYGRSDVLRTGSMLTIAASGAMVTEALGAINALKTTNPELSIELVAVSSIKHFDDTLLNSIKKTGALLTVEDHNIISGLGHQLAATLHSSGIHTTKFASLGVEAYQLSGPSADLYRLNGLDAEGIKAKCLEILR